MLSIAKLQARAEYFPWLKHGLRLLNLTLTVLSNLLHLTFKFNLVCGLKLVSLPFLQAKAPEIDLADIE